jgi:hypothetical protein
MALPNFHRARTQTLGRLLYSISIAATLPTLPPTPTPTSKQSTQKSTLPAPLRLLHLLLLHTGPCTHFLLLPPVPFRMNSLSCPARSGRAVVTPVAETLSEDIEEKEELVVARLRRDGGLKPVELDVLVAWKASFPSAEPVEDVEDDCLSKDKRLTTLVLVRRDEKLSRDV